MKPQSSATQTVPEKPARRLLRFESADLLGMVVGACLLPVLSFIPILPLQVVGGIFGTFFLPGYALVGAVFPDSNQLDQPSRIALSISTSVAVIPLFALVLDRTGLGLWPYAIRFGVAGLVLLCTAWTAARRYRAAPRSQQPLLAEHQRYRWLAHSKQLLAMFVILGILGGWTYNIWTTSGVEPKLTEFYVLGSERQTALYPREIVQGQAAQLYLGITNREGLQQEYRVVIRKNDAVLQEIQHIAINEGVTWEQPVQLKLTEPGLDQEIQIELFRGQESSPYRRLSLWLNVREQV